MMAAKSGLQKEVLALYRAILRAARHKDPTGVEGTVDFARTQFRQEVRRRCVLL